MKRYRTAFVTTHPIQYHAHWFRALASVSELDIEVFFCHRPTGEDQSAAGFGVNFDWDIPLLDGYRYTFLRNEARAPRLSFAGLDTPVLKQIIQPGSFDAVIVNGWHYKSAWQAFKACWSTKTPLLVRSDSHLHTPRHPLKRVTKSIPYRWFVPRLDGCLAVGRWSHDYFLHYGANPQNIFQVPHCIDESRFYAQSCEASRIRSESRRHWCLSPTETVFLFVGKFIPKKCPLDFLRAIEIANMQGAQAVGLMVGDGPLRGECETLVAQRQLPVRFAGFLNQSEIRSAYMACDALVLPSNGGETWGLAVNEAMVCGRPGIVSDRVGCGPDLVENGETGFQYRFGDVEALAARMAQSCAAPSRLKLMGEKAQNRVLGHFSTQEAVTGVLQAITVLTQERARACA